MNTDLHGFHSRERWLFEFWFLKFHVFSLTLWFIFCALLLTGCETRPDYANARKASVLIKGSTLRQIKNVTEEVFQEERYSLVHSERDKMVFEKGGSKMDNLAYGTWMEGTVYIRVKLLLLANKDGSVTVESTSWVVQDHGTSVEQEFPRHGMKPAPFQKLLDEVAHRLDAPAKAS
jgi:hypothetical protein